VRLLVRLLVFLALTLIPTIVFLASAGGSTIVLLVGIWVPAVVILLYFEAFLDATVARPWCVPFFPASSCHFF
jgi:hypothetical protein